MDGSKDNIEDTHLRLKMAETQAERAKLVMESLAGFCHALGQPATVILSAVELLKMEGAIDDATRKEMVDICYDAVLEIKSLLAEMKVKREYVAEAYLAGDSAAGNMISLPEWRDKSPPKASWDK